MAMKEANQNGSKETELISIENFQMGGVCFDYHVQKVKGLFGLTCLGPRAFQRLNSNCFFVLFAFGNYVIFNENWEPENFIRGLLKCSRPSMESGVHVSPNERVLCAVDWFSRVVHLIGESGRLKKVLNINEKGIKAQWIGNNQLVILTDKNSLLFYSVQGRKLKQMRRREKWKALDMLLLNSPQRSPKGENEPSLEAKHKEETSSPNKERKGFFNYFWKTNQPEWGTTFEKQLVTCGALGNVEKISLKTGKTLWKQEIGSEVLVCIEKDKNEEMLLVGSGSSFKIHCLHRETGEVLSSFADFGPNETPLIQISHFPGENQNAFLALSLNHISFFFIGPNGKKIKKVSEIPKESFGGRWLYSAGLIKGQKALCLSDRSGAFFLLKVSF